MASHAHSTVATSRRVGKSTDPSHSPALLDRRAILAGAAASLASFPVAAAPKSSLSMLKVRDDHAAPFVKAGEFAVFDYEDTSLEHGAIYMTVTDSGRHMIVGAVQVGPDWYAGAPNRAKTGTKLVGPMSAEFFRSHVAGRLTGAVFTI